MEGTSIVVPGSVSNLGPGFDALSVAVDLSVRLRVLEVRPTTPDTLETVFAGEKPAGDNRVETAFHVARRRLGMPTPGLRVEVESDIPVSAGLGSSAAATIAGFRLYEAATVPRAPGEWLRLACELEGHPDNAAAAVFGGLTISCQCDGGRIIARSWEWPDSVRFVVATPALALETRRARRALPATVSLEDAVFNLQRAVLLVRALSTGCFADLREALRDRWHQPARSALVPALAEALTIDHPAVLGVCLSGAGPSIVALATAERSSDAALALGDVHRRLDVPHTIRILRACQPLATGIAQKVS